MYLNNDILTQEISQASSFKNPIPRFTGLFIPSEILEIQELTLFEVHLLSWIDALYCRDHGGCFASNEYLATKMRGAKENTVSKALTRLRSLGLIEDISFNGRQRVIRACIGKSIEKSQSKAALDLNPTQSLMKIQGSIGQKSKRGYPSPYISYSKVENKEEKFEPPSEVSNLTRFFYEKLKEINPKIREPNLKKWDEEMHRLKSVDARTDEEVRQTITFIVEEHKTSTKDFTWAKAIASPAKLRKHFASIWLTMTKIKGNPHSKEYAEKNKKIAERIESAKRADIIIGHDYIEFINGPTCVVFKFDDPDFFDKCNAQLARRNLKFKGENL